MVYAIRCLMYRWRCVKCGVSFVHLSRLCAPFKRYLRGEIEGRSCTYVETESMNYREVVKERGAAVVYDGPIAETKSTETEKEAEVVRALAPSTVHRWISGIAGGRKQWQPAVRLAQQFDSTTRLRSLLICAAKYRSEARKRVLETCGLILRAFSILTAKNPTKLATLGSSP